MNTDNRNKGIGASHGIGIGRAVVLKPPELSFEKNRVTDTSEELSRYRQVVKSFVGNTETLADKAAASVGDAQADILRGHILIVQDPCMSDNIESMIKSGDCAEEAVSRVCDRYIAVFSSSDDELTRQRAADMEDIKKQLLMILLKKQSTDIRNIEKGSVICIRELTPSMTVGIDKNNVAGIVTETGGAACHAAILARALEIPAVLSVKNALSKIRDGDRVIVDGISGSVTVSPTDEELCEYEKKRKKYLLDREELKKYIGKRTVTSDGRALRILCNIGKPEDADEVTENDGEGVGLFRTEFMFMDRNSAPTEEEQLEAYRSVLLKMKNKPVTIRTLDIGGDKSIPYLDFPKEDNTYLGYRAIRYCLGNRELFSTQLRALLRASVYGDLRIMIPMISCIEEIREVRGLIEELKTELDGKGQSYSDSIKLGIMMETPSACITADLFAKEVDFFSIGTNDLIQYTMAADRGNADVAYLYSVFNPAVLRLIKYVIESAHSAGIPVGMCGEAASDERLIPLLITYGLDEFSVLPSCVLQTRRNIAKILSP